MHCVLDPQIHRSSPCMVLKESGLGSSSRHRLLVADVRSNVVIDSSRRRRARDLPRPCANTCGCWCPHPGQQPRGLGHDAVMTATQRPKYPLRGSYSEPVSSLYHLATVARGMSRSRTKFESWKASALMRVFFFRLPHTMTKWNSVKIVPPCTYQDCLLAFLSGMLRRGNRTHIKHMHASAKPAKIHNSTPSTTIGSLLHLP